MQRCKRALVRTNLQVHLPSCLHLGNTELNFAVSRFYFSLVMYAGLLLTSQLRRILVEKETITQIIQYIFALCGIQFLLPYPEQASTNLCFLPDGSIAHPLIICHEKLFKHISVKILAFMFHFLI